MKKLLIIGPDSIHTHNYIALIADYFDELLLVTNKKKPTSQIKAIEVNFSLRNPLNYLTSSAKIHTIIKDFKPSVIHIHQANSYAFLTLKAAKNLNIPTIVSAWGSDILLSPARNYFLRRMVQYILRHATSFTSDSKHLAEEMRKLLPERKLDITLANFGIGITPSIATKENIIYTNRLHKPLYRTDKIIVAFKKFLSAQTENWKLVIAGVGEETKNLKSLTASLGLADIIKFTGWLENEQNSNYYARAKIFVSIPESDATSISLLEAMANGCIPVLSDIPANREWITDSKNGILVKNTDIDFFSAALNIDSGLAAKLNRELSEKYASKEINKAKFLSLYNTLIN